MTDPLPLDAVKWCGTVVMTDEELTRRKRTAELMAPDLERERLATITLFDALIKDGES